MPVLVKMDYLIERHAKVHNIFPRGYGQLVSHRGPNRTQECLKTTGLTGRSCMIN